ncbi:MAG: hypothetical protein M0R46_02025 [Candidatus Muirbacterium halophilum]|nr:hypothetical protein [Candidatus Muirbacterium halophilum]MCK9474666.1 hypothetical protein [Candidatus Muirbacterium halophilum]
MSDKINISILTNNDKIWNILLWEKTINKLINKYNIQKIYIVPDKISDKFKGIKVPLWYINTFGIINFLLIGIFSINRILKTIIKTDGFSFENISKKHNIEILYVNSLKDNIVYQNLKKDKTNILLILTTHIINKKILNIKNLKIINQFCGDINKIQGIMPYFWSYMQKIKPSICFHIVNSKINSGNIVLKFKFNNKFNSMIDFTKKCFYIYPFVIDKVILNTLNISESKKNNIIQNYCSYPTKKHYKKFKNLNGKIITLKDLF